MLVAPSVRRQAGLARGGVVVYWLIRHGNVRKKAKRNDKATACKVIGPSGAMAPISLQRHQRLGEARPKAGPRITLAIRGIRPASAPGAPYPYRCLYKILLAKAALTPSLPPRSPQRCHNLTRNSKEEDGCSTQPLHR